MRGLFARSLGRRFEPCVYRTDPYSCTPSRQHTHIQPVSPVDSACNGTHSQGRNVREWVRQTGLVHESVLPALTLISKMGVCVWVLCSVPHCMSCGGPCLATNPIWQHEPDAPTTTPTSLPPPPWAEPCIKGHYITPSSLSVTLWGCLLEWQRVGS